MTMQGWQLGVCALAVYFCVSVAQEEWGYRNNGSREWARNYPDCGLNQQSPIRLPTFGANRWCERSGGDSIRFLDYSIPGNGIFTNNGHTVNLVLNYTDPAQTPRVVVTNNDSRAVYHFQSLHFHWPSEHKLQIYLFPLVLELHMVHRDTTNNRTLVLGYLFRECWLNWERGMEDVASVVRRLTNVGDQVPFTFAPQRIMAPYEEAPAGREQRACGYYSYTGSLTTPPCSERVAWMVYAKPQCVTRGQMEAFESVLDASGRSMTGNARPLQPVNGRPVNLCSCSTWWLW